MTARVLEISHLTKTFPGTIALRDVDFEVAEGEVHALVGANGSGKSTLIKCLAGVHQPDPGASALVRGQAFDLGSVVAADQAGIRFVHQDVGLVPNLDTADNFAIGRRYAMGLGGGQFGRIDWRAQRTAAHDALRALGHDIDVRRPVSDLSASQKTAIAIARSLQGDAASLSLLVLDEPTASLPKPEVDVLFDIVRKVRERGISVIYISHHLDEVFAVADRVTVLRDGERVTTRDVAGLTHDELVELMVGKVAAAPTSRPTVARDEVVLEAHSVSGKVLRAFDLTAHRGEIVGIAGITGSGRDEVAMLLFGGKERRGTVKVSGHTLAPMRPDKSIELGMGLAPANRHEDALMLELTVLENITVADLRPYWKRMVFRAGAEHRDGTHWLDRVSVNPRRLDPQVGTLSGGNQQKVVIAKWLRLEPKVLVLDEPTQGVDVGAKPEIHALLDEAAEQGTAVIVCSSDEAELERLCHRVIVLNEGRIGAELVGGEVNAQRITQLSLASNKPALVE